MRVRVRMSKAVCLTPCSYQGMIPCYLKVVPSIAISFCTYEVMRRILGIAQKTNFGAG